MRVNVKENNKKGYGQDIVLFAIAVSQFTIQNPVFSSVSYMMMRKVAAGLIMTS